MLFADGFDDTINGLPVLGFILALTTSLRQSSRSLAEFQAKWSTAVINTFL